MAKQEETTYYFARERHMASVVWNPKKNAALAEFTKAGVYATKDKGKAETLLGMGYMQVDREEIIARHLPVPEGDEPLTLNFQPGAPGRGYNHDGAEAPVVEPKPQPFTEVKQGSAPATEGFPEVPPGKKRTLR